MSEAMPGPGTYVLVKGSPEAQWENPAETNAAEDADDETKLKWRASSEAFWVKICVRRQAVKKLLAKDTAPGWLRMEMAQFLQIVWISLLAI